MVVAEGHDGEREGEERENNCRNKGK
jgi:hypothetical protein